MAVTFPVVCYVRMSMGLPKVLKIEVSFKRRLLFSICQDTQSFFSVRLLLTI